MKDRLLIGMAVLSAALCSCGDRGGEAFVSDSASDSADSSSLSHESVGETVGEPGSSGDASDDSDATTASSGEASSGEAIDAFVVDPNGRRFSDGIEFAISDFAPDSETIIPFVEPEEEDEPRMKILRSDKFGEYLGYLDYIQKHKNVRGNAILSFIDPRGIDFISEEYELLYRPPGSDYKMVKDPVTGEHTRVYTDYYAFSAEQKINVRLLLPSGVPATAYIRPVSSVDMGMLQGVYDSRTGAVAYEGSAFMNESYVLRTYAPFTDPYHKYRYSSRIGLNYKPSDPDNPFTSKISDYLIYEDGSFLWMDFYMGIYFDSKENRPLYEEEPDEIDLAMGQLIELLMPRIKIYNYEESRKQALAIPVDEYGCVGMEGALVG